jgi:hypothetical protein
MVRSTAFAKRPIRSGSCPVLANPFRHRSAGPASVDLRRQIRKRQQEISKVTFRVDRNDRHPIDGRLLNQGDAQAGLAIAGHTHAHRMGREVAGVIQNGVGPGLAQIEIVPVSQKNDPSCS